MLATLLIVIVVTGLINVTIDPLGVFDSPRMPRINTVKPYLDHHRELARHERAVHACANTGIFGNSRAEIGFDPESASWAANGLSAFNNAIPGRGPRSSLEQIIWLHRAKCLPKTILLGVDFFDFLGGSEPKPINTSTNKPPPRRDAKFFAESVFSINGLRDSLATVALQSARYPATLTDRGFNPLLNYVSEVEQSGHYLLFRQRAEENLRNWKRKPMRLRPPNGDVSDDEATLEAILAHTAQAGVSTYIVIYPYHAQIRMMLERLGAGQLFAEWKRMLVGIAEKSAAQGALVQVWDFSGIGPETLEAIPPKGDRKTHLAYYWEAGHFKKELGDQVIARLLGMPGSFGMKLDAGNIDAWLTEDRRRVLALFDTPSPLRQEVEDLFVLDK